MIPRGSPRQRGRGVAGSGLVSAGLAVALLATACSGSEKKPPPPPVAVTEPSTAAAPSTTSTTVTTVPGVPRSTTTVAGVALGPGDASLSGTVTGPDGAVSGATVRVERLVGREVAATDLRTDESGSWQLSSILGGPYRVRAYMPPSFGQIQPEVFFLAADERRTVSLAVSRVGENSLTGVVTPNPPVVDQVATLVVRVGNGRLDDRGVVTVYPRSGVRLVLSGLDGISLESAAADSTDGEGKVTWTFRCVTPGTFGVTLTVGNGTTRFSLPPCVPSPASSPPPPP